MRNKIENLFETANAAFLHSQKDLILSGVSERCLCGSFMTHLRYLLDESEFKRYHADIEYNRNFDKKIKTIIDNVGEVVSITCDLIVHSRGQNIEQDNLLAIEMKYKDRSPKSKEKDRIRLKALTKPTYDENQWSYNGETFPEHVCGYLLGIFYEINNSTREVVVEYYDSGQYTETKIFKY